MEWKEVFVPGDGNCLFHSLSVVWGDKSSQSRRETVVSAFLHPRGEHETKIVASTKETWKQMKQVFPFEMKHVVMNGEQMDCEKTAENMRNPLLYWGDEFALSILEERENIHIGLIEKIFPLQIIQRPKITRVKKYCCVLKLVHSHYTATLLNNQGVFLTNTCPDLYLPVFNVDQ